MTSGFVLNPSLYDDAWDKFPIVEALGGLKFSQVHDRNDWIVKLRFKQAGDTRYGTGFYINIPDAKKYVILTAGHNLIDEKGNLSQDLVVLGPSKGKTPTEERNLEAFLSASYKKKPSHGNMENDFGAILVPKSSDLKPRGFGFALKLGHDNLLDEDLDISGYRVSSEPGQPITSTGPCIGCQENQLEYDVLTEKGLSGSPVFMPYKGHETAVAIHNNGPKKHNRGSRGTRLNEKVLEEIFGWVKVGYKNKTLNVFPSPTAPPEGLYLRFPPHEECAWVRLGDKGLETSFDIFPAYAPTSNVLNSPLYVFRFRLPPGWPYPKEERWVLWDIRRQSVALTSTLQEFCFPRIMRASKKNPDAFRIVLADLQGAGGELLELRMQATEITEQDINMEEFDTSEVSFERYFKGKPAEFNNFCFQ